jgi:hypothetical protein
MYLDGSAGKPKLSVARAHAERGRRLDQFRLGNLGGLGCGLDLRSGLQAIGQLLAASVRARLAASFGCFALAGQRSGKRGSVE